MDICKSKNHSPDVVRVLQKKQPTNLKSGEESSTPLDPNFNVVWQQCFAEPSKKTAILAPASEKRWLATLRQGVRGLSVDVATFGWWLFFWRTRGLFFRLMDVHLLTWANVMLYFQQLLHADVTSSKCRPQQWDVHVSTRASGMLYFDNFCMQMWPHQNCCPRLRKQHCHTLPVDQARLCLPEAYSHQGRCRPTLISLWISMQRTCNTRATHVQHTCNTTCNTSTFTVNLQVRFDCLFSSACYKASLFPFESEGRPATAKKHNVTCKFTVKVLVLHVVLHVCCTCVARALHGNSQASQWSLASGAPGQEFHRLGCQICILPNRPRLFLTLSAECVIDASARSVQHCLNRELQDVAPLLVASRAAMLMRAHLCAEVVGNTTWHLPEFTHGHYIALRAALWWGHICMQKLSGSTTWHLPELTGGHPQV